MIVKQPVAAWLRDCGVLKQDLSGGNDRVALPEHLIREIEYGWCFERVIYRSSGRIFELVREKSPSAKARNWHILFNQLKILGILVTEEAKALVLAGDRNVLVKILEELHTKCNEPSSPGDGVCLERIEWEKATGESLNCLEGILLTIVKGFGVKPRQAVAMLAQENTLLTTAVTRGASRVIEWYSLVEENIEHLTQLARKDDEIEMILSVVSSAIRANNEEIILKGLVVLDYVLGQLKNREIVEKWVGGSQL